MATEAGPRGAIPAEEARALAGRRGETVEEVMLGRLEQASGYAQAAISNFKVGAVVPRAFFDVAYARPPR